MIRKPLSVSDIETTLEIRFHEVSPHLTSVYGPLDNLLPALALDPSAQS
jgi:hypothetical protein